MPLVRSIFNRNFLEYASYVIKDRAIPHLADGFKPVQRRIIHSLLQKDDGKFHKVANVVGHCMQYHPHGDASIYSALVVLANKDLFIEKQGNFGNIQTGDPASAARYIECRITELARELLYNPEITDFDPSYDGRNREPVVFRAKAPIVLMQGAEGIAVGMSTRILPHNFVETLDAVKQALRGRKVQLLPDFPTGGLVDVSGYEDGQGKVLVRARLDTSDPKRIVIRELPFGATTESIMNSIENAAKKGRVKIQSISDFTTEEVEIEIKLARGVYSSETVESLFAYTDCEMSISTSLLVIKDERPAQMTVSEVIAHHAGQLVEVLTDELELEQRKLEDRLHARTLERIFIEERIYKKIEEMETQEAVHHAVLEGFKPFKKELRRPITDEDIERLLKIPIRRISLYDINKNRKEVEEILARIDEVRKSLANITDYAVEYLEGIIADYGHSYPRRTQITSFDRVDVRDVAERDLVLRYDNTTGYLGHHVPDGKQLFHVSGFDRVLVIKADGTYFVTDAPEKLFVGQGMLYCGLADKEMLANTVFSVVFENAEGHTYIKRTKIEQFIIDKEYELLPEGVKVQDFTTAENKDLYLQYKPAPRLKILEERIPVTDYLVKGARAGGVRVSTKPTRRVAFVRPGK